MSKHTIDLTPDLKGVVDTLIENTGLTIDELISMGLFLYHPDIFLSSNIENVKLWLFFDKTEQKWLNELCGYYKKSESEMILDLIVGNETEYLTSLMSIK